MIIKIVVGKKEFPCRVTMGAMLRFQRESGKDVKELNSGSLVDLTTFLWCCVMSACAADGVTFGYSLDEFADRIDADSVTQFYSAMEGEKKKAEKEKT